MTRPDASIILPARGRAAQTAEQIPRLLATAGNVGWELIVVVDADADVAAALRAVVAAQRDAGRPAPRVIELPERRGYWNALSIGSQHARGRLLGNIANDVLPGLHWLSRAVRTFDRVFTDGLGVVGWNDGLLFDGHAGHLLISRALANRWYGAAAWPTFYDHLWGDVEICQRAIAEGRYVVDLRAVLYHNHPVVGRSVDAIYQYSHHREQDDERIFAQRRQLQWPTLMPSD